MQWGIQLRLELAGAGSSGSVWLCGGTGRAQLPQRLVLLLEKLPHAHRRTALHGTRAF